MSRPPWINPAGRGKTRELVTEGEVEGLTRWAQAAILRSAQPAEELGLYARELELLRAIADPEARAAIDRFETIDGVLAVFQREARLGRSTASAIRKELTRPGGLSLAGLGTPYACIDPGSIRWGDEAGGTIRVGFERGRLRGRFDLPALTKALQQLAVKLEVARVDARVVQLMRQRYVATWAD